MGNGKWLDDLKADTPLADAARLALSARLKKVRDALPQAVAKADDPDNVHDLRVGTRRARAALDVFRMCLPKKQYRKARKKLRLVRRVAGAVRDWDVFLNMLLDGDAEISERDRAGFDFLAGYALAHRERGQEGLNEVADKYSRMLKRCQQRLRSEVRAAHESGNHDTMGELACEALRALIENLNASVQHDLSDYANLHQVRIAGKRLRYAMEIFAACFPATFKDELYPKIEVMQEILGKANDSHVACQRITTLIAIGEPLAGQAWEKQRPGIDAMLADHEKRQATERHRFEEWWRRWKEPDGEERLLQMLETSVTHGHST